MNITAVQFLAVPVTDLDRAAEFYVGRLGFEVRVDIPGPHGRFLMVGPKHGQTTLVLTDFSKLDRPAPGSVYVQLLTGDVDADVAELRTAGLTVADPQDAPWGRLAEVADTEGNSIGLLQAAQDFQA
ncbi:VOC family protein [Kutzneria viridogrisea]|uniref:VOC domain-containing protein n=2 Tax=Kutzneria TaxID=43356 RepID=W5W8A6_9PSEU|nr:VOC family protein [Kutzneria albida]AHH96761.1 hypothetical protein KALB_3394 [Kutzneria albida DSM 43870]MBA8928020.1 putative enzyme related to lactoylglutathione lyase [Kutzneria viridogrisea]